MTSMTEGLCLRSMSATDPREMAEACGQLGWNKPVILFEMYFADEASGTRSCWVAYFSDVFAGYVTVNWKPTYPYFAENGIPEIQDLNVLPPFQRKGIGTALLVQAEAEIASRSNVAGLGVGLHPGYNEAQRLYVKRGYVPDGRGVTYKDRYLCEGEHVLLDDDFLLHMTRRICP
jgi:GNAT superfamily N-acetyltransferase